MTVMHWLQRLRQTSKFVQTCVLNTYVYIYIYIFIFIFKCDSNIDDYIYICMSDVICLGGSGGSLLHAEIDIPTRLAALLGRCSMLRQTCPEGLLLTSFQVRSRLTVRIS